MRRSTEAEYRKRLLRALEFIRANLDREFTLEELASAACFSPFHFHRVFTGMTGETVAALVRRLKLERAAQRLIEGSEPVLVIALRTGYDSNQAFTRAFSAAFGEPPSRFRELRKAVPHLSAPSGYHYNPESVVEVFNPVRKGDRTMDAKTVELMPLKVLCMRHVGPYHLIGGAFEKLDAEVGRAGIDVGRSQWLAIYHDDPDSVPQEKLRSDACVTVEEFPVLPGGSPLVPFEIPGGLYATSRLIGPYSGIPRAWMDLVAWMPANGLRPRCAPCFEIYVKGHESTSDESEFVTDLYEPAEPLIGC